MMRRGYAHLSDEHLNTLNRVLADRSMTPKELAGNLGVRPYTLRAWLHGKSGIPYSGLVEIRIQTDLDKRLDFIDDYMPPSMPESYVLQYFGLPLHTILKPGVEIAMQCEDRTAPDYQFEKNIAALRAAYVSADAETRNQIIAMLSQMKDQYRNPRSEHILL